jgi:hypothetical protein
MPVVLHPQVRLLLQELEAVAVLLGLVLGLEVELPPHPHRAVSLTGPVMRHIQLAFL